VRQNSNFHLLKEAYEQVLAESKLPPVGPGVCYFETESRLTRKNVKVKTTTGEWEFIKKDRIPIGIMSVENGKGPSGSITSLDLYFTQLTSFDGSGLCDLTVLNLGGNRLTSFNGSGLSALTRLDLYANNLTSFDGSGLSALTALNIFHNKLTSFDGSMLNKSAAVSIDKNPFHNLEGPAVILPDGTEEFWVDGDICDEHDYKVARAKYLRHREAAKAMEEIGLEGLFDGI
jgi:hypothetical protein